MNPLNVIIVEDSEDDLILIMRALKKAGYEPSYTQVETAAALKDALADDKWQLVISDHSMPVFSAPLKNNVTHKYKSIARAKAAIYFS